MPMGFTLNPFKRAERQANTRFMNIFGNRPRRPAAPRRTGPAAPQPIGQGPAVPAPTAAPQPPAPRVQAPAAAPAAPVRYTPPAPAAGPVRYTPPAPAAGPAAPAPQAPAQTSVSPENIQKQQSPENIQTSVSPENIQKQQQMQEFISRLEAMGDYASAKRMREQLDMFQQSLGKLTPGMQQGGPVNDISGPNYDQIIKASQTLGMSPEQIRSLIEAGQLRVDETGNIRNA